MIRRLSLLAVLLFTVVSTSFADEEEKIILNEENNYKTSTKVDGPLTIFVEAQDVTDKDEVKIKVKLENNSSNHILLFKKDYDEKELKKNYPNITSDLTPKIKFAKYYPGIKGQRKTEYSEHLERNCNIQPYDSLVLFTVNVERGKKNEYSLPIYFATCEQKGFLIWRKDVITLSNINTVELNITVESKPDSVFPFLKGRCELLRDTAKRTEVFCPNPNHKPSLEVQKQKFQNRIEVLRKDIDEEYSALYNDGNHVFNTNYKKLMNILESIKVEDITLRDCGKCKKNPPKHSCPYCNYKPEKVRDALESIYRDIDIAPIPANKKKELLPTAKSIYGCPNARSRWEKDGFLKGRIDEYYQEIKQF